MLGKCLLERTLVLSHRLCKGRVQPMARGGSRSVVFGSIGKRYSRFATRPSLPLAHQNHYQPYNKTCNSKLTLLVVSHRRDSSHVKIIMLQLSHENNSSQNSPAKSCSYHHYHQVTKFTSGNFEEKALPHQLRCLSNLNLPN